MWTEWAVNSPTAIVSTLVQGKTRCLWLSDWGVLLLDVIMNIAVIIYSRHLNRWRHRGLTLLSFWKECTDPDLHKCYMFARIIRDPALSTEEVSIRVFYESLQIAFPNNALVRQFRGWSKQYCSSLHGREGRGQQSSLAFKATWTIMAWWKQSWFWQGKEGVFYTTIEKFML